MDDWQVVTIDEIKADSKSALSTGPFGSSIGAKLFREEGVPVIRGSNLSQEVGTRLIDEGLVFVEEDTAKTFQRSMVREGDLVFTCWGTINQVGLIDRRSHFSEYIISNKQMKLTPDRSRADSLFLYYMFSSPKIQSAILASGIGSSVPGFNLGQLRSMEIDLPPLSEQRAIANVLGALDDKIELNRTVSATIEATARALFTSWFVDFDPVRAKAEGRDTGLPPEIAVLFPDSFVRTAQSEIPSTWKIGDLNDLVVQRAERCAVSEETIRKPYVPVDCISPKSLLLGTFKPGIEAKSSLTKFYKNDILFGAMRPYFHKVCVAPFDGTTRTTVFVLRPKERTDFAFATLLLHDARTVEYATAHSTGTTIPYAVWSDSLDRMPVVIPPAGLRAAFGTIVEPMLSRISATHFEQNTLAEMRDALLPKLICGEVRVTDAARIAESSA